MPNDVEIIVTSKVGPMRQYSEQLENRIRAHGMAVDVLFPREDIPLRQVLMDLSERGTMFAIVLTPLNEEHRSVTLNILFGPQPEGKCRPAHYYGTLAARVVSAQLFHGSFVAAHCRRRLF